jgi:tetratricopeptide (TPR) repeat protein
MHRAFSRWAFSLTALLTLAAASCPAAHLARPQQSPAQQSNDDESTYARRLLNEGVQAYKNGRIDQAIEAFKQAKDLDPALINARLYLATAYASEYIPGAPSEENIRLGQLAIQEFQGALERDPRNLPAIDGIGSTLYNMAGMPFDVEKMEESKKYWRKHIEIRPDDPEPYYWIGVLDWSIAFRGNREMREEYNKTAEETINGADPMPPALTTRNAQAYGPIIEDGIVSLQKAVTLRNDYDDALAYLNLLYRQKADTEISPEARDHDIDVANDLVDKVKTIKQRKLEPRNPQ